jgi:hypothetical protein
LTRQGSKASGGAARRWRAPQRLEGGLLTGTEEGQLENLCQACLASHDGRSVWEGDAEGSGWAGCFLGGHAVSFTGCVFEVLGRWSGVADAAADPVADG